jgi:FdhD protein
MRTPGSDDELAAGFLYTEGIIKNKISINNIELPSQSRNEVTVVLKDEVRFEPEVLRRNFYMTSSCGVCGKSSVNNVRVNIPFIKPAEFSISRDVLLQLPGKLKAAQKIFASTGGLHASAVFSSAGELILMREDVGRHNALDKLIGAALTTGLLPLQNVVLLLSGRASFELIQKAAMAHIPIVAAIGAPSGLAVSLAKETGITLAGFLRESRFNIYSGAERIQMK